METFAQKLQSLLAVVPEIVDMIFNVATKVMAWIWSEPIVLIPLVFGFVMIAIKVVRSFVKK
jgi:hypothetical protein